ncbi:hypothetical protein CIB84_017397, partial [Bambusicola thoracicus]
MSSACFLPISLSKKDHHSRNLWALIMLTSHARSRRQTRSNAVFAVRGGLPSHAQRVAVNAAFTYPVLRMASASPSTSESTGPSAGSTALDRQQWQLQQKTPPASSARRPWGTLHPTTPWCAQRAHTPGSTGPAS